MFRLDDLESCGEIQIGEKIGVTDPCYGSDFIADCIPGPYKIYLKVAPGINCMTSAVIFAHHSSIDPAMLEYHEVYVATVDAGIMSIGDAEFHFRDCYSEICDNLTEFEEKTMSFTRRAALIMDGITVITHS